MAAVSNDPQPGAPSPLALRPWMRLTAALLGVLVAAYGLAVFVAFQYLPAQLVAERTGSGLLRGDGLAALAQASPWALAFALAAWAGLAWRRRSRGLVEGLVEASKALWPMALVATTLWFDDRAGRQVLAAALMGLVAYRAWPLIASGSDDAPLPRALPDALRELSPRLGAALLALGGFALLLVGAWARHEAQWSSLIDLGLFYELYDNADGTLLFAPTLGQSFLGEHFSPSLVLLWPVMAVFPSPVTLLVVQSGAIALGAWLLFELAHERLRSAPLAAVIMVGYLLSPWVQAAALYDFHMDMLEPPMLFGLALALQRGKARWVWVSAALLWLTKEDTFIYTSVFGLYAWLHLKRRRLGLALIGVGLAQAAVVLLVLLPAVREPFDPQFFSTTGPRQGYAFLSRYSHLGETLGAIVGNAVANPLRLLDHLTTGARLGNLLALLMAFGGLGLFAGWRIILLAPTLEMLLANPGPLSAFSFYYGAVAFMFAPLVAIEGADALLRRPPRRLGHAPTAPRLAFALGALVLLLVGWHPTSWLSDHHTYKPVVVTPHHAQAAALMARIPQGARVSATGYHAVHLQPGRDVRMFPFGLDQADWVLVDLQRPPWPRDLTGVRRELTRLPAAGFALEASGDGLFLFRRADGVDAAAERRRVRDLLAAGFVVEAELSEQTDYINRVASSDEASNGAYRAVDQGDRRGPGYLLYGPYVKLPRGEYTAVFRLRWRPDGLWPPKGDRAAVTLDVASSRGRKRHAARELKVAELTAAGDGWREERLDFSVSPGAGELEARVYYHDLGALDLDVVRVERRRPPR